VINKFGNLAGVLKAVKDAEKFAAAFRATRMRPKSRSRSFWAVRASSARPARISARSFDELKIPGAQRDKKGNWGRGNDALQALSKAHKVIPLILECREKSRAASAPLAGRKRFDKNRALAEMSLRLVAAPRTIASCRSRSRRSGSRSQIPGRAAVPDPAGFRSLIQRLKTEGLIDDGFDVESVPKMTITAAAKAPGEETSAPAARPTSSAAKPIRPATDRSGYGLILDMKSLDDCNSCRYAAVVIRRRHRDDVTRFS